MGPICQALLLTHLEEASGSLRRIARLLLQKLLLPRRIVRATRRHLTTITYGGDCPLSVRLATWASSGGGYPVRARAADWRSASAPIGLVGGDATGVVLRGDGVGRPRVESLHRVRHRLLLQTVQIQIHI